MNSVGKFDYKSWSKCVNICMFENILRFHN
uniref:Uncharacterized protein n=1 Tax=Arundo donax TaxID=35708 RepID=A0A0A9B8L8_ARUDO